MDKKIEALLPRGMRDILPEQMVRRQYVMDVIRGVFEEFGFEPLTTPAVELEEVLKGKYGEEAERLIYSTTYGAGEEKLSLRYDLSVPLCRVMAMYPELPKPFKRYQLAPVWRAERPQKGRYREFYQCDADTVGSSSMLGDAETVAVVYTILYRLGFRDFVVNINNRKLLNGIGEFAGVPAGLLGGLYQSIDKLAKIGADGVRQELLSVGIPDSVFDALRKAARLYLQKKITLDGIEAALLEQAVLAEGSDGWVPFPAGLAEAAAPALAQILAGVAPGSIPPERVQGAAGQLASGALPVLRQEYGKTSQLIPEAVAERLLELIAIQGEARPVLATLRQKLAGFPQSVEGIRELEEMVRYLDLLGVPGQYYAIDASMVRGLEYYTGPIYETIVREDGVGSVTGGGRFDNLVGMFSGRNLPATGTTIGIERIIVVMEERNMFPAEIGRTAIQVLVTAFNRSLVDESIRAAALLRQAGLRTQVGYADKKGIPIAVIIGPDEALAGKMAVRSLRTKEQQVVDASQAAELIKGWLG
jgi:histidyl-tRNA synthetase